MDSQKWQPPYEGLSKRAVDILRLLAAGMSDREIAERLTMTINTVKWYNRQIYSILDVGSRTQAIARASDLKILSNEYASLPSLQAIYHPPTHNLPVETTRFIGRKHEIQAIKRLLDSTHLLTLVGSPGTGKTRLALQVTREMKDAFGDEVYFVSLAPLNNPAMVINAIANAVGVNESHPQPLVDTLKRALRERHMLLLMDNFEHLLPAAPQVSELLSAAPNLTVLATSREPLHLYGEHEYGVQPLSLPDSDHVDLQALAHCESTALFIQQAQAVRRDFTLTAENALDIVKICMRLEGLPLAIELAAAHIKLLPPHTLLARLASRLDTLTGGALDLPARQQTLHNTIEWSYNLLSEGEKMLFARLSTFEGGQSLEAIESVCSEHLPINIFDGLTLLVDKSLIQQKETLGGELRFFMLETIYEYARERLAASGEMQSIFRRHAEFFVELAERVTPDLRSARFSDAMRLLETEEINLRIALEWAFGDGDIELGLRLVSALRDFWVMSLHSIQAMHWTQLALAKSSALSPELRAGVLTTAGYVLYYSSAQRELQIQLLAEAVELARAVDDRFNLAWALIFLGVAFVGQSSHYESALAKVEEGLSIFRELGHKTGIAQALNNMGELMRTHGDYERAQAVYEECLVLATEIGESRREATMLFNIGFIAIHRGDLNQAEDLFRKGIIKKLELRYDKRGVATSVALLASAIAAKGGLERAVRLFGAADALLEPVGIQLEPADQPTYERYLGLAKDRLDAGTFSRCWNEGCSMSYEQMVSYAL